MPPVSWKGSINWSEKRAARKAPARGRIPLLEGERFRALEADAVERGPPPS